jgi:hypothetical protein
VREPYKREVVKTTLETASEVPALLQVIVYERVRVIPDMISVPPAADFAPLHPLVAVQESGAPLVVQSRVVYAEPPEAIIDEVGVAVSVTDIAFTLHLLVATSQVVLAAQDEVTVF